MNDSLKTLVIVGFLALILWNLGAGLYYMLVDKGQTKRTVNALTKRIALSVVLQLAVVHLGFLNVAFGTVPLSLDQWLVCVAMASAVLWFDELRKLLARVFEG